VATYFTVSVVSISNDGDDTKLDVTYELPHSRDDMTSLFTVGLPVSKHFGLDYQGYSQTYEVLFVDKWMDGKIVAEAYICSPDLLGYTVSNSRAVVGRFTDDTAIPRPIRELVEKRMRQFKETPDDGDGGNLKFTKEGERFDDYT
jgi:hypothetical protein